MMGPSMMQSTMPREEPTLSMAGGNGPNDFSSNDISSTQPTRPEISSPNWSQPCGCQGHGFNVHPPPPPQGLRPGQKTTFAPPPAWHQQAPQADYQHPLYSSPLGAAINVAPMGHDMIPNVPMNYSDWKINQKVQDTEMGKFNGDPVHYRMWRSRIRDHLCASHQPWARLLDCVEKWRHPLTVANMALITDCDGAPLDLPHLSRELWTFLGPRLGEAVYTSRIQKAGGKTGTGLSSGATCSW